MATNKTLTPTNVTIQIPEFTDQPDQRVNSNCIDKEADAINSLDTKLATMFPANGNWVTNGNLNNIKTTGYYPIGSGNTNAPGEWGLLSVVAPRTDQIEQIYLYYSNVYVREFRSNTWSAWQRLAISKGYTASGTTSNYGLIASGKAISEGNIYAARVSDPTTGLVAIPVQVSNNWQFLVQSVSNGQIVPSTSTSVTITFLMT